MAANMFYWQFKLGVCEPQHWGSLKERARARTAPTPIDSRENPNMPAMPQQQCGQRLQDVAFLETFQESQQESRIMSLRILIGCKSRSVPDTPVITLFMKAQIDPGQVSATFVDLPRKFSGQGINHAYTNICTKNGEGKRNINKKGNSERKRKGEDGEKKKGKREEYGKNKNK